MRAMAGPAMLLVIVGGFAAVRCAKAPDAPSRDFLDLEFAAADPDRTGTCYSLSTVLIANAAFSNATREWKSASDKDGEEHRWTLHIDDLVQGVGGQAHVFQRYTFERRDDRVHLVALDVSEGQSEELSAHVDALLEAPNDIHSTPVERCADPAVTGYKFERKKSRD